MIGIDDRPQPLHDDHVAVQWLAFSFQHLMVAFAAMIGVPLAFSSIVKLGFDEQTAVISGVLVAGGVVTMIQSLGIGPIGARLPLVNDATFKFLGPLTLAYKFGGFGAIYGAAIISGFIIAALGFVVAQIQRFFNTFIVGAFLIITGVSLMPIALNSLLAIGKPYEATSAAFVTAAVPLAVMIYLSLSQNPYVRKLRTVSVLLGSPYMFSARNAAVLTLGLVPAVSLRTLPQSFLARIPQELAPLLTNALVTGLLIALLAHLLLPGASDEPATSTEQHPDSA